MGILFKYMRTQRTLFDDGFIRASQLSALNDPFEAMYCEKSLNELADHFDEPIAIDPSGREISFSSYVEEHKNHIGVISLTEAKDNLLMWAHYAYEHSGICVGFSRHKFTGGMFLNLIQPDILLSTSLDGYGPFDGVPVPVMYRKQPRYRVDKFDYDYSNISAEGADKILFEVFLQKSEEWIYEKEHRIVLRLEQADKAVIFDLDNVSNSHVKEQIVKAEWCSYNEDKMCHEITLMDIGEDTLRYVVAKELSSLSYNKDNIYLFKLKPNAISHCLLGLKCKQSYQDVMSNYTNSVGYFDVWQARQNNLSYTIDFEQIGA